MARYVNITIGCDWADCDQLAPENDDLIKSMTVAIDGKTPREFQLCKAHRDTVDEMLLPLMQAGINAAAVAPKKRTGTPRSTPAPVPGTVEGDSLVCKAEGCDRHGRPLANRTGMAQHVIRAHQYADLADYEAEFGTVSNMPKPTTT